MHNKEKSIDKNAKVPVALSSRGYSRPAQRAIDAAGLAATKGGIQDLWAQNRNDIAG